MDDKARLRRLLGEPLTEGIDDTDTLFSNEEIDFLLAEHGSVEAALGEGWRMKAASLAGLVDTTEGTSKRAMSDLHKHAVEMVKHYSVDPTPGSSGAGVTYVHQAIRE